MVERGGFEPPKAEPTDLQSVPFGHSGTSPHETCDWDGCLLVRSGAPMSWWSWRWDSNPQPADYKSAALPIELRQHTTGPQARGPISILLRGRCIRYPKNNYIHRCARRATKIDFPVAGSVNTVLYLKAFCGVNKNPHIPQSSLIPGENGFSRIAGAGKPLIAPSVR